MLRERVWKGVYRSEVDSLLEDFYVAALRESVAYDRAVGFFSASMLSYAAQGISALVENGGRMRLIFGGEIDEADARAMSEGYEQRGLSERMGKVIIDQIENLADSLVNHRLSALAWLVANGLLDIRLALKRGGMYHEKIGIFSDAASDKLVFQGSANESARALLPDFNFESINVFPSWRSELQDHYVPYIDGFERLWTNQTKNTLVINFPEAAREHLVKIAVRAKKPSIGVELDLWNRLAKRHKPNEGVAPGQVPAIPATFKGFPFEVRKHQKDALNAWRGHDCRGILAMATGSGKTLTAIYGAIRVFEGLKRLFLVIAVPYQSLADQWIEELAQFNIEAIPCYEAAARWMDQLSEMVSLFDVKAVPFVACVVVNRTLHSEGFQQRVSRIPGEAMMFIGDECHHHGATGLAAALPGQASMRVGLSATPKHYFDSERTATLVNYYGEVVYEYSLAQALKDEVLTPYRYLVHPVTLTTEETEEYLELSKSISRLAGGGISEEDLDGTGNDQLKMLLFRRARVLGNAANKLVVLNGILSAEKPHPLHLFSCGDGYTESADPWLERQVDQVSQLLSGRGWRVSHFTSRESRDARTQILNNFKVGIVDGLVAIKCLDEGIDVPDCRTAYILASSRNPKQFIQRRGRILRRAPGKELATIHDFIVQVGNSGVSETERKLVKGELERVAEFASLAVNYGETFNVLQPILEKYDLSHVLVR